MNEAHVFDTPEKIQLFHLAALKGRCRLEGLGIQFRGPSALTVLRSMGFKGTRAEVITQVQAKINGHTTKEHRRSTLGAGPEKA